jgi:OPA family glycerol-3-phosphate transporter-like MFS transporter/OPA family sugar phosphate sensor protein UhpC-like MFS transporter
VNLIICFSPKLDGMLNLLDGEGKATLGLVYLVGSLWVLNGYLQGMGVPPCVSLLAHWVKPDELATKQSLWNVSHTLGAGIVVALCGFMLDHFGYSAWYLCFIVPALIALLGVPVLWFGLKDDPSEVGLPPVEKMCQTEGSDAKGADLLENLDGASYKRIINRMVFANPYIWIIGICGIFNGGADRRTLTGETAFCKPVCPVHQLRKIVFGVFVEMIKGFGQPESGNCAGNIHDTKPSLSSDDQRVTDFRSK